MERFLVFALFEQRDDLVARGVENIHDKNDKEDEKEDHFYASIYVYRVAINVCTC